MASRRELSECERGMTAGARRMGHCISDVVLSFNILWSMVSCVCREYLVEGTSTHRGQRSGRPQVLNDRDQRRLARIDCGNRQATLAEITSTFNAGGTRPISSRSVQRSLASMGYGSRRPTRVPLLTARHRTKQITWACEVATVATVPLFTSYTTLLTLTWCSQTTTPS
jgi:transposase